MEAEPTGPVCIAQRPSKGFRFAQVLKAAPQFPEREQGQLEVEPDVDPLLDAVVTLRKVPESGQSALEVPRRLPVRSPGERLGTCLAQVRERLLPCLGAERVVSQPLEVLGKAVRIETFDRLENPGMKNAPPLLEKAAIGDFIGEGMLEDVFDVGEQAHRV